MLPTNDNRDIGAVWNCLGLHARYLDESMPPTARASRRSAIGITKWIIMASILLSLFQLMLGADPVILMLCLVTEAVCLAPVLIYGLDRTIGIFYLILWFAYSFSSLLIKTVILQPIDSNLFNPLLTFMIQLAGGVCFSTAAIIAYFFKPLHRNTLKPISNAGTLSVIGLLFYFIGAAGFFIQSYSAKHSLIGNIGILINPLIGYGIVCEISATIIRTKKSATFSITSILMLSGLLILGILGNTKSGVMLPGVIYLFCLGSFKARLRWQTIVMAAAALVIFSELLFPAIHIARGARERADPVEMAGLTLQAAAGLMTGDSQTLAERDALDVEREASADAYRNVYFGSQQVWLDRFTNTGFIDAVARRLSFDGPFLGLNAVVWQSLTSVLPRQLNPNKYTSIRFESGDSVLHAYGLKNGDQGGAATVPLPAELFAADGFWAIFVVGLPLITIIVFEINFLVFDYSENPWAICFLIFYGMQFYAAAHDVLLFMAVRQIPFDYFEISLGMIAATFIKNGFNTAAGAKGAPAY